jgi:hypothetical protein
MNQLLMQSTLATKKCNEESLTKEPYQVPTSHAFVYECKKCILSGSANRVEDVDGEDWTSRVMIRPLDSDSNINV